MLAYLCVCCTKVIHPAYINLSRGVLRQIIHDIIVDVLDTPVTAQRYSTNRVDPDMIKKRYCHRISYVFKHFLSEWRTRIVSIQL